MSKHIFFPAFLIVLVILAVLTRYHTVRQMGGVSGGDPYNYLSIAEKISKLQNPFDEQKRLPGYPLLLVPALLTPLDDIRYMQSISILSAAGILIILALLIKQLGLPWPIQIVAPLILSWQKDFFVISLRPEPYTLYAFLLLLSLWLFFIARTVRTQIIFGVVLGYAAMTRQEGFVLAAILVFASVFYIRKLWWQGYVRLFLPALLLILPFLIHNTIAFGNPLFTPYFKGERLQIVDSWPAFKDSLAATWGVLGSLWKPSWSLLERVSFDEPALVLGILFPIVVVVVSFLPRPRMVMWVVSALSTTLVLLIACLYWEYKPLGDEFITRFLAGALLSSPVPFLIWTGWRGAVIILVLLSQIMIATWFHPFPKHYQQAYPILVMLLTTTFICGSRPHTGERSNINLLATASVLTLLIFSVAFIFFYLYIHLNFLIDRHNQQAAFDSVTYRAVQTARTLPGPHGFEEAYLPARLYFDENVHFFQAGDESTAAEQLAWIEIHNIHTMVVSNATPPFAQPQKNWQEIARFKAENRDEKILESVVYTINE